MLYLVRHAKAGSRSNWLGDDTERPLSANGKAQADALGRKLAKRAAGRLLSSPYVRCVQTLEPLAHSLGTSVESDERLAEAQPFAPVIELLAALPDGSVLCSHGDVIPEVMAALERRGCRFDGEPDWRKATTWVLERDDGDIVSARCWPPPNA